MVVLSPPSWDKENRSSSSSSSSSIGRTIMSILGNSPGTAMMVLSLVLLALVHSSIIISSPVTAFSASIHRPRSSSLSLSSPSSSSYATSYHYAQHSRRHHQRRRDHHHNDRRRVPPLLTSMASSSVTPIMEDDEATSSSAAAASSSSSSLADTVLTTMGQLRGESAEYAEMFDLTVAEDAMYALFTAIRQVVPLNLKGQPFVLRHDAICRALQRDTTTWPGFFTMGDLEKACQDDFLDAARGSTDTRKGWQITDVSEPRGDSFEEARMTFEEVEAALDKGTVIFNAAGAHVPKLAGPCLAVTDATMLPCAMNIYVTAKNKKTSAPPHTDRQDVVVVQTSGRKYWRVYSPPNPHQKPTADMFARGKHDDKLPLHALEKEFGCELLIETTLNPGDVLFMPSAFPHTTSTVTEDDNPDAGETSIHMTLNIDHHVWELDYLSARRLAMRRACVVDTALGQSKDEDNRYVGKANELPDAQRKDLFAELPLGLLDEDETKYKPLLDLATTELERISREIDTKTAAAVDPSIWRETIERVRQEGTELFESHRDMYLAALDEGRTREAEDAMTAHLANKSSRPVMTPERMARLSVFRVKRYYDQINESKRTLNEWSLSGKPSGSAEGASQAPSLPEDWAFTMPVKVGDQVQADLGGAFFEATVTGAAGGKYDVQFFDGDKEAGLDRSMIKLLNPPALASEADTSQMTKKQLKRWKKQQEKLQKKGLA